MTVVDSVQIDGDEGCAGGGIRVFDQFLENIDILIAFVRNPSHLLLPYFPKKENFLINSLYIPYNMDILLAFYGIFHLRRAVISSAEVAEVFHQVAESIRNPLELTKGVGGGWDKTVS